MAAPNRKGTTLIATNRTARRDYDILDTLEVVDVPEVALAAREDFEDTLERLEDVVG